MPEFILKPAKESVKKDTRNEKGEIKLRKYIIGKFNN